MPPPASLSHQWRVRGACGDTPSPSAAATARIAHERREGASYKQVMIVFLASQRDPHKSDIKHALHLSVPSPRFSPGYRIHVISQPVSSVPRPSPLLLTTSHGDAAGVWLCSMCVTAPLQGDAGGPQDRTNSHTPLVGSQVPEGLPPPQGMNTASSSCIYKAHLETRKQISENSAHLTLSLDIIQNK